jgi:hypothetical protein
VKTLEEEKKSDSLNDQSLNNQTPQAFEDINACGDYDEHSNSNQESGQNNVEMQEKPLEKNDETQDNLKVDSNIEENINNKPNESTEQIENKIKIETMY